MVGDGQLDDEAVGIGAALAVNVDAKVVPAAAQFSHGRVDGQQVLGRGCAQGHDDLGADGGDLPHEERNAGFALVAFRCAVPRRPALDYVGNVDVLAAQAHGGDHIVQQLPGAAHKGQALLIFIGPRAFTNEHQLGMNVAGAEDDVFAPLRQTAAGAVANVFADNL